MSPHPLRHTLSRLAAAALMVATPALADWEADLNVKTQAAPGDTQKPQELKGKMAGRPGVIRMDMSMPGQAGGDMSTILDFEKGTGTVLMHAQKRVMQRQLQELPMKFPASCTREKADFDACYKEQGFKKVGTEKVNGHPTTVYEGTQKGDDGKPLRQKVWRPTDLAEVPYVRAHTFDGKGKVQTELNLTNIRVAKLPDSRFAVPAGYQALEQPGAAGAPGAMPGGFKPEDFQGKTPEQIQKMIRERMGQGAPPPGSEE